MKDPRMGDSAGPNDRRLGRRGFAREVTFLILIGACVFVAYLIARGDAATMAAAFLRRVRAMGQPE